ncbi:5-formyltetrahydrofolate cyclo-ligase [Tessaracoccus bendigoensis DSM 12906]|uniref:5-formyltetrahydrofolate cyclo-ligase n=1 Tax=Tessaracoccus bendigoensis DSM 12906 TaxID=1123357 RepID=A0A1M6BRB5_9ACTN|nr:5-formyltetrahydrofolate cyclo-ligase [Tessaracoccus bendigoensis]SHI51246.1 5-formyltetrahydrofolate cyclo-ligase [Tessaracoccus bendigoensis DSM 12906]
MHRDRFKEELRVETLAARARMSPSDWEKSDAARDSHILDRLAARKGTVALYSSRPGEPGTHALIDALAASGWAVLLPVLRRRVDWALFDSWAAMQPAWAGIEEPTGARLGPDALDAADLILVPCLAIGRDGSRLGTGGGWYDRALPHRHSGAPVVALARAAEVLDTVPTLPHDIPVDAVVTETEWVNLATRTIMDW